jgi:hypothetical protein
MESVKLKCLKGLIKAGDYVVSQSSGVKLEKVIEVCNDGFIIQDMNNYQNRTYVFNTEYEIDYLQAIDFETALAQSRLSVLQNAKRLDEIERINNATT